MARKACLRTWCGFAAITVRQHDERSRIPKTCLQAVTPRRFTLKAAAKFIDLSPDIFLPQLTSCRRHGIVYRNQPFSCDSRQVLIDHKVQSKSLHKELDGIARDRDQVRPERHDGLFF